MTEFSVIAVGRMKDGPLRELANTYVKRLVWPVRLIEVEARGGPESTLKAREAEAIRARIPAQVVLVALDERGKMLTSPALANWIGERQVSGTQHIVFIIGGADGLDDRLRAEATLTLAFGQMTWPHMLARVMLLEQLYRAQQILAGHPYHRV